MDTAGESPVKRVKKIHCGRRSSAGQKKRDQRNEKYYPGAFAFAWLAQNNGTASGSVDSASDTSGSPQDSWADAGGANESDGSECERCVSGWWQWCGQGARGTWS